MLNSETVNTALFKISSVPPNLGKDEFMWRTVEIVHEEFDFYFVGLFLIDAVGGLAIFQAGNGEIGQQMIRRGWTISLTKRNLWTNAVHLSEIRINNWMKQEAFGCPLPPTNQTDFALTLEPREEVFPSPLFPDTSWQLILPLLLEQQIIGILEIQSDDQNINFNSTDIRAFLLLANQITRGLKQRE